MDVLLAAIVTDGVTFELTIIVIPFEVAVDVLAHVALLVITAVITSLFDNEVVV